MTKSNLDHLESLYNAFYRALYDGLITAPDAAAEFNRLIVDDDYSGDLVAFDDRRGDIITSDREAAAYYLAYKTLNG